MYTYLVFYWLAWFYVKDCIQMRDYVVILIFIIWVLVSVGSLYFEKLLNLGCHVSLVWHDTLIILILKTWIDLKIRTNSTFRLSFFLILPIEKIQIKLTTYSLFITFALKREFWKFNLSHDPTFLLYNGVSSFIWSIAKEYWNLIFLFNVFFLNMDDAYNF